jgi:cell wall-associated NlpC family hydrolase
MEIPVWAARYIGAAYKAHGRGPAYDCWGLLAGCYRDVFGITLPSYDERYAAEINRAEIAALISGELGPWRWVPQNEARPGDGILFKIAGQPCHVGVVVAPTQFLHVQQGTDACIEDWSRTKWSRRFAGVFRHEAMA